MGLISFLRDKFVLKGQSSELGKEVYIISLSYSSNHSLQFMRGGKVYFKRYTCSFDTRVWAHNQEEAVERSKEKWMEQEREYIANGVKGRVKVPKEGMYCDIDC